MRCYVMRPFIRAICQHAITSGHKIVCGPYVHLRHAPLHGSLYVAEFLIAEKPLVSPHLHHVLLVELVEMPTQRHEQHEPREHHEDDEDDYSYQVLYEIASKRERRKRHPYAMLHLVQLCACGEYLARHEVEEPYRP